MARLRAAAHHLLVTFTLLSAAFMSNTEVNASWSVLADKDACLKDDLVNVNVCFNCDSKCRKFIEYFHGADSALSYFKEVADHTSMLFIESGLPIDIHVGRLDLLSDQSIYLQTLVDPSLDNANGGEVRNIVNEYWHEQGNWRRLRHEFTYADCNVGFLVTRDQVLTDLATAGYANIASLCAGNAYGLLELQTSTAGMSQLLAHELGHVLGMYHDDDVETRDIYDTHDVHENCNKTDGSHIMSMGPSETHLDPDGLDMISNDPSAYDVGAFSACSKAMMRAWAGEQKSVNCLTLVQAAASGDVDTT